METLFFAAMGWCGTKHTGWRYWLAEPDPVPWKPQPDPWKYAVLSAIGVVVGVIGGLFINDTIAIGQKIITSGLFSFAVSNIVTGFASTMMSEKTVR